MLQSDDEFLYPKRPHDRFACAIRGYKLAVIPLEPLVDGSLIPDIAIPSSDFVDTIDDASISQWDAGYAEVGLLCGEVSGVTVLKVSTRSAFDWLCQSGLPDTPNWLVFGQARYFLFHYKPDVEIFALRDGLELINNGPPIVFPGSIFPWTQAVTWDWSPDHGDLADLPDWLFRPEVSEIEM